MLSDYPIVLVSGATGWLGRRVVRALTEGMAELGAVGAGGRRVRCLVPAGESTEELRALGADLTYGSITDPQAVDAFVRGAEGALLIHLAGIIHAPRYTRFFNEVNFQGSANLVAAARRAGAARVVAMSSNSPFGGNPTRAHRFDEDAPYHPYMGYGRSKWHMERFLRDAIAREPRPEIVILRAPWFYGPGQPPRQTLFFRMIRAGRFPILGDGLNLRSMGYVDTLALGILLGADSARAAAQIYWIADARPYTMVEIVDTVKSVLAQDFGLRVSPRNLRLPSVVADAARAADRLIQSLGLYQQKLHVLSELNMTIACDISKARRDLGFAPLVDLREGMRRSVDWVLRHGPGSAAL